MGQIISLHHYSRVMLALSLSQCALKLMAKNMVITCSAGQRHASISPLLLYLQLRDKQRSSCIPDANETFSLLVPLQNLVSMFFPLNKRRGFVRQFCQEGVLHVNFPNKMVLGLQCSNVKHDSREKTFFFSFMNSICLH